MKKIKDRVILEKYHLNFECMGHTCEDTRGDGYFAVYENVDEYLAAKAVFDMSETDLKKHARELYDKPEYGHDIYYCEEMAKKHARSAAEMERDKLNFEEEISGKTVYAVCRPYEGVDRFTDHHYAGTALEAFATSKEVAMQIMSMAKSLNEANVQRESSSTNYGEFKIEEVKEKTKE